MDNSKILMFPEYGYGNNNGFGLGGWGGGILGFLLGAMLFGNGFGGWGNGFGFNGAGYGLANQMNNDNNTDLIMNAINGTDSDVRALATTLNADFNQVSNAIGQVRDAIQTVGAQNGMGFLQVTNAIQSGNAAIAKQLCECCCENRLLTTQLGYESQIRTIEQTNQLGSQADRNTASVVSAINNLHTDMTKQFCDAKERDMQNMINSQGDIITQLRNQIAIDNQSKETTAMFQALDDKIDAIASKQPNTVPVTWPNISAVNNTPYAGNYYGTGYWGNGFGNNIIF